MYELFEKLDKCKAEKEEILANLLFSFVSDEKLVPEYECSADDPEGKKKTELVKQQIEEMT